MPDARATRGRGRALSFQLYALQHEEMRAQLVALNREVYRVSVQKLLEYVPAADLPMPAEELVRVLHETNLPSPLSSKRGQGSREATYYEPAAPPRPALSPAPPMGPTVGS